MNKAGERLWRSTPGLKHRPRSLYYRVNARKVQDRLAPADRDWLTAYFADEVAALREMTARRAASRHGWGAAR